MGWKHPWSMAKPRKQACSGREDGAPIWSMDLVVGTGNGVGFVPRAENCPSRLPAFCQNGSGQLLPGRTSALGQDQPLVAAPAALWETLEICNFALN